MKASELRIGNFIYKESDLEPVMCIHVIISILEFDILKTVPLNEHIKHSGVRLNTTEPIPLSQEWLIKFGFDGVNSANKLIQVGWNGNDFIHDQMSVLFKGVFITTLKYVHQLQNLYFTLTGEELTLNP